MAKMFRGFGLPSKTTKAAKAALNTSTLRTKSFSRDKGGKKTITTLSACCGKPVSITNEKGVGDTFVYDATGNLTSKTDARHHTTKFSWHQPRFNHVSEIRLYDGSYIRFIFDKNGNLALSRSSTGEHVKLVNEPHGKILSMTDHRDVEIRFEYNRFGKATLIEKLKKGKKSGPCRLCTTRVERF